MTVAVGSYTELELQRIRAAERVILDEESVQRRRVEQYVIYTMTESVLMLM